MLFTSTSPPKKSPSKLSKAQVVERLNLSKLVDEDHPVSLTEAELTQSFSKLVSVGDAQLV